MNYLSIKLNFDRTENNLSQILNTVKTTPDFIDLTVSNPTTLFKYDESIFQKAFSENSSFPYCPEPKGLLETRRAISNYFFNKGRKMDPDKIFLTSGTSEAISFILKAICDSKSEILISTPGYPLYDFLFNLENVIPKYYQLKFQKSKEKNKLVWEIDFDSVINSINENTKAIVLVEPNNPTGSCLTPEDSQKLSKIVKENNLILIIDEVFSDYYENYFHRNPFLNTNCIFLNGISKMLGLPQMKLSWIYLQGDSNFIDQLESGLELISDCYLSVNAPVQKCLKYFLDNSTGIQDEIKKRIKNNTNTIKNLLSNENSLDFFIPDGGWYMLLQANTYTDDLELSIDLLKNKHVYILPGYMFDLENSCWLVTSLLTPEQIFKEGIQRLMQFVNC